MDNEKKPKVVLIDEISSHSMKDIIKILKDNDYEVEVINENEINKFKHNSSIPLLKEIEKHYNMSKNLLNNSQDRPWYQSKKYPKPKY